MAIRQWLTHLRDVRTIRLLTRGQFALYSFGNGISLTGSWMQRVGYSWLVWDWTGSAFWLGLLAAADLLPIVLIGPIGGVVADRLPRLRITRVCQIVLMVLAGVQAALLFAGMLGLGSLLLLVAVQGSVIAVSQPARLALVQELVARDDVPAAVALNSVYVNLTRLVGAALAGLIIVRLEVAWIFAFNALLTGIFVAALGLLRVRSWMPVGRVGHVFAEIAVGFRYVAAARDIRAMLLLLLFGGSLVRSSAELLPAFAAQSFPNAAAGLAALTSAMAVGAIAGGLSSGRHTSRSSIARSVSLSWLLGAVTAVFFGFAASPLTSILAAGATGFFVTRSVIGTQTFVQLTAADAVRGRALSVHGLISRGSPSLGALAIGFAADLWGLSWSVLTSGLLLLISLAALHARSSFARGGEVPD